MLEVSCLLLAGKAILRLTDKCESNKEQLWDGVYLWILWTTTRTFDGPHGFETRNKAKQVDIKEMQINTSIIHII